MPLVFRPRAHENQSGIPQAPMRGCFVGARDFLPSKPSARPEIPARAAHSSADDHVGTRSSLADKPTTGSKHLIFGVSILEKANDDKDRADGEGQIEHNDVPEVHARFSVDCFVRVKVIEFRHLSQTAPRYQRQKQNSHNSPPAAHEHSNETDS
jgi:hypothetical protein